MILTEKQQKYQNYFPVKLINMNVLKVGEEILRFDQRERSPEQRQKIIDDLRLI